MGGAAFGGFWGAARRAAIDLRRATGDPWGPVYVCEQTVRSFCSGARGSEVGGEQAVALSDQALSSIASDQSRQVLVGLRGHVCDGEGGPDRELFNIHVELFEVPPGLGVEGAVRPVDDRESRPCAS